MLDGLGLRTFDVGGDKQQRCVHDCGAGEHSGQEDLMSWAIAEGYMALEEQSGLASLVVALGIVFLIAGIGLVAIGGGASGTPEHFGIGISQSNRDISHPFLSEPDSGHSGNGSDDSGLTVSYVSDGAYIECGLSAHDLRGV